MFSCDFGKFKFVCYFAIIYFQILRNFRALNKNVCIFSPKENDLLKLKIINQKIPKCSKFAT